MPKLTLVLVLLCTTIMALGQETPSKDTAAIKKDSTNLEELKEGLLDNTPTLTVDDNDLGDGGSQNISSLLTAGRDPYYSAAAFNFSAVRFRIRGYDNDQFSTYMNGIPMDNLDNGFTPYGLWGGLNDVMRNRDVSYGLNYNTFSYGDIGSNTNIDTRASKQRKQTSFGYALSNRNYNHRWTITHSSGLSKKGWAYTLSGSRRWAGEGYVPGTYYDGWSYFAGFDKRINSRHLLSLVAFGAPTENGRQGAAVQEMMDLAGTNYYNPNWGYQNGKKRNASVGKTNQPVFILTHDMRLGSNTTLLTGAGYSFGDRSVTALDWYNAPDPRPDYYRYLPSYYNSVASQLAGQDLTQYNQLYAQMSTNENLRQIDWQRLYDANRMNVRTVRNADGIAGNDVTGKRSVYIIENRIVNTKRINANTVLNTRLCKHVDLTAGASYQAQKNRYYKKVDDLLGGDFYVNLNQFAERDFPTNTTANQYNVDKPNGILHVGDTYGYDYNLTINKAAAFAQGVFRFNKVDFNLSSEVSHTEFWRTGNVRNGLFPTTSYGKGEVNKFTNYGVKAGVTYKLDGRNYFFARASYGTKAPFFENVYISPRSRSTEQNNIKSETTESAEAGYVMNSPKLKLHVSGYYTHFKNQMDVMTFYHDGYQNFVNYALSGIDKLHFGGEFGAEVKLTPTLTANAAAAVGRYYYDSRQHATVTVDNSTAVLAEQTIYSQNFRVPSTPQNAYSLGLTYRSPKFWFVSLTGNYFDQNWLSFNPIRRTFQATDGVDYKSATWNSIIDQTKFAGEYTLDFFGGYSWKLPKAYNVKGKSTFLVFNAGVNNLLNNKTILTGGYEQLRFDDVNKDINKFPPKLFYAYGLNYFVSVNIRF